MIVLYSSFVGAVALLGGRLTFDQMAVGSIPISPSDLDLFCPRSHMSWRLSYITDNVQHSQANDLFVGNGTFSIFEREASVSNLQCIRNRRQLPGRQRL